MRMVACVVDTYQGATRTHLLGVGLKVMTVEVTAVVTVVEMAVETAVVLSLIHI